MSTVFIVIPNYNGARLLAACLGSLQSGSDFCWNIVVVDDASEDDSVKIVQQHCTFAHLLRLPKNKLFAASANAGIEYALTLGADYIFLLNSDTEVSFGCLEKLLHFMHANPSVDACQPLLVDMDKPGCIQSAGLRCSLSGRGWDNLYLEPTSTCSRMPLNEGHVSAPFPIMGCTGGAVLFRAAPLVRVLEHEKIFDESLRMYLEDLDLCFRFHQNYAHSEEPFWCVPEAKVKHVGGGSTAALGTAWKVQLTEKNALQMVLRYFPFGYLVVGVSLFWATSLLMAVYQACRGCRNTALGILQGALTGSKEGASLLVKKRAPLSRKKFHKLITVTALIPPVTRMHKL